MEGTPSSPATPSKHLAAIDIGSNSIRLLVAEVMPDGRYRILDDEKETTRLAQGLANTSRLQEKAMDQSIAALSRMKAIAEGYQVERLEVIATSAVREAANQKAFLEKVRQKLDLNIEVIATTEEGELSFASAAHHFDLKPIRSVVVDLGGGSAELIFAAKGVIETIASVPFGAVRLTDAYLHSDPLLDSDFRKLKKHVRKVFKEVVGKPPFVPHTMIGAGGTFLALANISMRRRGRVFSTVGGYEMNRSEVRHIFEHLRALSLRQRRAVPGLHADRADIIVAGVFVIERLMKMLQVNRLLINDQGVRDGLMLRLVDQAFRADAQIRDDNIDPLAGARQFAAACTLNQKHPEHVTELARQLFDQLQVPLRLPAEDRVILEAAGLLHEVGYLINYESHHQHSYHLILHGNLRGLSPKQRELAANVARYHRRSTPTLKHESFTRLQPRERETVRRMSALLRLADGLDRTHTQCVKSLQCFKREREIVVAVIAAQKPEVDLWCAREKGKYLEKVFGMELALHWQTSSSE